MKYTIGAATLKLLRFGAGAVAALALIILTIMLVRAFDARRQPDLQAWHTTSFAAEFRVADVGPDTSYEDVLAAEAAAFEELDRKVMFDTDGRDVLLRYERGNVVDPASFPVNWNRSFEMRPERPWGGIVLIHGLTDSPYSVRALAEVFRDGGLLVVAPRMPGHGLAPSGLLEATWQDWLAVVRLAARYVQDELGPDAPLLIGGYSNGGALAVKYTLDVLEDDVYPKPAQVYLFSPAIGITRFAAVAGWHRLLAGIPYFHKFRWEPILPEYDPYKYNSFPKIAGHQSWDLARAISRQLRVQADSGRLLAMPPVLTFQSLADATVLTSAIVNEFYERLQAPTSELVLFDINRRDRMREFVRPRYLHMLDGLESNAPLGYTLTIVSNTGDGGAGGLVRTRLPGGGALSDRILPIDWPPGVYSMSHVAVPFPPDDPIYGAAPSSGIALGNLQPRGERGVLTVPIDQLMRLRHNPFFPYMRQRIEDFLAPLAPKTGE
jgi:alpha-beta hydrolase superfamily lysophospholipase